MLQYECMFLIICVMLFAVSPTYRCDNHTEFDCRTNYRCIPLWAVCNGHNDCRDNSDEQNCGETLDKPTNENLT